MRVGLFWRILPLYIVIAGIFLVPVWQRHLLFAQAAQAKVQAESKLETTKKPALPLVSGTPIRIVLPNQGIDLAVVDGTYDKETRLWSVSSSAANYATNTFQANNKNGKTLIYGHATSRVLGRTKSLSLGDAIYVYTNNQHILKYSYTADLLTAPTDTEIFDQIEGKPGVVLVTCDGNWSEKRRLMFFELVEAS